MMIEEPARTGVNSITRAIKVLNAEAEKTEGQAKIAESLLTIIFCAEKCFAVYSENSVFCFSQ